ncbi:unnamed protein product [Periconia digitata]|uniref:Rhodopsin domain-containing protein n=1 Tax=Periconia digitata TaxID=1303443 RepID=A0A9W4XK33_9PLEO|nr:unnamed protein product [Periconia digitata]
MMGPASTNISANPRASLIPFYHSSTNNTAVRTVALIMTATTAPQVPSVITTSLLVVTALFPALSLLSVVLRWASRRNVKSGWQSDDWAILATWAITFAVSIDIWALAPHIGVNYATHPIRPSTVSSAKCVWSVTVLTNVALAVVKISFLLFYKRIFVTPNFIIVCWFSIACVSCWGIITSVLYIVQADPISSAWTGFGTFRYDPVALSKACVAGSLALDITILLLPTGKIMRLQMSPRKKMTVALIFALGGFCCIAAAVRLSLVFEAIAESVASKENGFVGIARTSRVVIWGVIEPNCSIIAASLPCYRPLFHGSKSQRSTTSNVYLQGTGNGISPSKTSPKAMTESEIELRDLSSAIESNSLSMDGWEENRNETYGRQVNRTATQTTRDFP